MKLEDAWQIFMLSMNDMVQEVYNSFDFYKSLTSVQKSGVDKLYKNSKDYSLDQVISILDELQITNTGLRDYILSSLAEDTKDTIDHFKTGFVENLNNAKINTIHDKSISQLAESFSSTFGSSFLYGILPILAI